MKYLKSIILIAAALTAAACTSGEYKKYAEGDFKWSMVLEEDHAPFTRTVLTCNASDTPVVSKDGRNIVLSYNDFKGKDIDVTLTFAPYAKGEGVEITSTITNNEPGMYVKGIIGPIFKDEVIDLDTWDLYQPFATGVKYSGRPDKVLNAEGQPAKNVGKWTLKKDGVYEMMCKYPSCYSSMQFSEFNNGSRGLYLASHDPEMRFKQFILRYDTKDGCVSYGVQNMMTCFTGQTVTNPGTIIYPHEGDWHVAADIYSEYYHSIVTMVEKPEWVDGSTAWMLTIMKQQNGELMWPYSTIGGEMTDVAIERGYNLLGLFGWTCGGHDKWYPEYDPDPAMGGEQGLKDGIARAHERGMKVIMYVNGQLIDTDGTKFWGETGESIVVRKADGSDYHQMWQKYKDCPARHHGMACQSDPRWREIMLDLAKQMNSYGADGIIYDQLGTTNVDYCYAPNHGHSVPAIVYENDKVANLKYVEQEMKKINPGFIVITEGLNEAEFNSISMFHYAGGILMNTFKKPEQVADYIEGSPAGTYFSELTKYVAPEWTTTNRIQAPVNNRASLNYCVLSGVRPEIECRYQPDVDYLMSGRMPQDDDYDNMVSKVDISMVKALDPAAARIYTKQVNDFLLANADILFKGKFVDNTTFGINTDSKAVRATAFVAGNRMGIVVWNASETDEAEYELDVKGWKLESVTAPDKEVAAGDKLAPSSIHLLIYTK